ncbi:hypothetical protein [Myroides odoratimimus]|uniref:hypothetical protein n=1 Tax=Myroides odoratimimus TaxID=76832 RepID=UPI0025787BA5|nr:hypothetical protein [Myroides odoratimimus]MDM1529003.1 hypothetical protein [Myroides odoratimimus]
MVEIEFPEANKRVYIPSNLGECNPKEFKKVCVLLLDYFSNQINYEALKTQITATLLGYRITPSSTEEGLANLVIVSDIVDSYFHIDENGNNSINLDIYEDKVPVLKTLFSKYHSCGDNYERMTYGQYADASRFFQMFSKEYNTEYLYTLLAILYTKKKEEYNSKNIDKRIAKFKKYIHPGEAFGVYLLFASFMKGLATTEINWRGEDIDLSILFEGNVEESSGMPGLGADSLVYTLAEHGSLGVAENVRKTNFWEVMLLMYELKKQSLEREKQTKNAPDK